MRKKEVLNMPIEGKLKDDAKKVAKGQDRSLASYVRHCIRMQVKRDKEPGK